jgi:hypothetical protein
MIAMRGSRHRRVLAEQAVQRGRTGARQAQHHQRRDDLLLVDFGMARITVLDLEPLHQHHDDLAVEHRPSRAVEPGFAVARFDEAFEPFAKAVLAEVVEAGRRSRRVQQIGNPAHHHSRVVARPVRR